MHEEITEVKFTLHALQRWVQRTRKRYRHIDAHHFIDADPSCQKCKTLVQQSYQEYASNRKLIDDEISERFWKSKLITHASDPFQESRINSKHFQHGSMVFVVDFTERPPAVITCFDLRSHSEALRLLNAGRLSGNRKKR